MMKLRWKESFSDGIVKVKGIISDGIVDQD